MDHNQDNLEETDAVFLFKKKYYLPEDGIKVFGVWWDRLLRWIFSGNRSDTCWIRWLWYAGSLWWSTLFMEILGVKFESKSLDSCCLIWLRMSGRLTDRVLLIIVCTF